MEIDSGDSPPITQKPYTLPLKHAKWVQKEYQKELLQGNLLKEDFVWTIEL